MTKRDVSPKPTPFNPADYLDTPEVRAEYISAALETGDAGFVRDSLNTMARARRMSGAVSQRLQAIEADITIDARK